MQKSNKTIRTHNLLERNEEIFIILEENQLSNNCYVTYYIYLRENKQIYFLFYILNDNTKILKQFKRRTKKNTHTHKTKHMPQTNTHTSTPLETIQSK